MTIVVVIFVIVDVVVVYVVTVVFAVVDIVVGLVFNDAEQVTHRKKEPRVVKKKRVVDDRKKMSTESVTSGNKGSVEKGVRGKRQCQYSGGGE